MKPEKVKVVLAPDVLGKSFFDSDCQAVLTAWRDSRILPVVTYPLLRQYLTLLGGLGLNKQLLREWIVRFTSKEHSLFVEGEPSAAVNPLENADWIVTTQKAGASATQITPKALLKKM